MTDEKLVFLIVFSMTLIINKVQGAKENETVVSAATSFNHKMAIIHSKINKTAPKEKPRNAIIYKIEEPVEENRSLSHQVGKTVLPGTTNSSNTKKGSNSDFKPSPQVNTYYEYNKFPVVPALAEPKHFLGVNLDYEEKPVRADASWWDKSKNINNIPTSTTQQTWYNKINFPTTQNPLLSAKNHPYPFVITDSYAGNHFTTTNLPYFTTDVNFNSKNQGYPYFGIGSNPSSNGDSGGYNQGGSQTGGFYQKFGDYGKGSSYDGRGSTDSLLQKTVFENPPSITSMGVMAQQTPWKKIFKFLSALIPIGLLLSALTPTVINISPMNNATQFRGRATNSDNLSTERLLSSIKYINTLNSNGCEERVICEMIMGAGSSSNAKQHIENLLNTFTDQERDVIEQIEELKKIFKAVKSGNCSSLTCHTIAPGEE